VKPDDPVRPQQNIRTILVRKTAKRVHDYRFISAYKTQAIESKEK
jgi:hypothetical protein